MWTDRLRVLSDVESAAWFATRLNGAWGTVGGLVPDGFAAYARVLHPAWRDDRTEATWADVAAVTGRRVHAGVQWHALVGSADPWNRDGEWPDPPDQGNLPLRPLRTLCDLLAAHTSTPNACFFGLWDGWAQLQGSAAVVRLGTAEEVPPTLTPAEATAPRLQLPGRDHLVLAGPLDAVEDLARYDGPDVWWSQSPSLIWPADHAWCVATEVDLDSTLVGGSSTVIEAIVASAELEAFGTSLRASVQAGSDFVNPPPA